MNKMLCFFGCLMLLSACTSNTGGFSDPFIPIEVQAGERFTIELESNATTGYSWVFGEPLDEATLRLVISDYITPNTGLTGAGGTQVWVFEALQSGTTTVKFEYKRSWETEPPISTADFTIHIK
jgi:inhibitor of cysteine peptidase